MRKNVFRAKGLTLLLTAALLVPQMSGVSADAKAKKPKLSRTKVSVTVGKTKKVTVKNAKKVTWKVTKKAAKIVKLTKKSKKGATIKGLKKGTAKISVQMKNGKKKVKKTITVKVSSAKKVVVTAEPAKTTNKPTNGKRANSDTDCNINNRTVGNAYCNADRRTVGRANFNTDTNATSGSW